MTCPKCSILVNLTADQGIAGVSAMASGAFIAHAGIFGMIAAPYLFPVVIGGIIWIATRKVACPCCGHRFTLFQEGKR